MPLSRAQLTLLAAVLAAAASSSPAAAYGQPNNGGLRGLQQGKAKGTKGSVPAPAPAPEPQPEPEMETMEEQPGNGNKKDNEETADPDTTGGDKTNDGKGGDNSNNGKGNDKDNKTPRGFKKGRSADRFGNPAPKGFGDEIEAETKKQEKEEQMKDKKGLGFGGKTLEEEAEDEIGEEDVMSQSQSSSAPGLAKKEDTGPPVLTDLGAIEEDEGAPAEEDEAAVEEEKAKWNNGKGKKTGGGGAVTEPEQDGDEKPPEEVVEDKPNDDKSKNAEKVPKDIEQSSLPEGEADPSVEESFEEPPAEEEKDKGPKEKEPPVNENRYEPTQPMDGTTGGEDGEEASTGLIGDEGVGLETDGSEPSPEEAVDLVDPTMQGLMDGLDEVASMEENVAAEEEAVWASSSNGQGNANGAANGNKGGGNEAEEE